MQLRVCAACILTNARPSGHTLIHFRSHPAKQRHTQQSTNAAHPAPSPPDRHHDPDPSLRKSRDRPPCAPCSCAACGLHPCQRKTKSNPYCIPKNAAPAAPSPPDRHHDPDPSLRHSRDATALRAMQLRVCARSCACVHAAARVRAAVCADVRVQQQQQRRRQHSIEPAAQ